MNKNEQEQEQDVDGIFLLNRKKRRKVIKMSNKKGNYQQNKGCIKQRKEKRKAQRKARKNNR